jgi:hypothetical protein
MRPLVTGLVPYMESGYGKFFTYMNELAYMHYKEGQQSSVSMDQIWN